MIDNMLKSAVSHQIYSRQASGDLETFQLLNRAQSMGLYRHLDPSSHDTCTTEYELSKISEPEQGDDHGAPSNEEEGKAA